MDSSERAVMGLGSRAISARVTKHFVIIFSKTRFVLFDLILYVPSTIFQLNRDGSSWVEPVLS